MSCLNACKSKLFQRLVNRNGGSQSSQEHIDQHQEEDEIESQTPANMSDDGNSIKAISDEIIDDCKEAFGVFVDKDGFVEITNLGAIMRALGEQISNDEETQILSKYNDTYPERAGKIDCSQFLDLMRPRLIEKNQVYNEVNIDKLFSEFDVNGDGYITASELRQSLQKLGPSFAAVADELTDIDVEEIIMESDEDGDGRISYSEFVNMIPRLNRIIEE